MSTYKKILPQRRIGAWRPAIDRTVLAGNYTQYNALFTWRIWKMRWEKWATNQAHFLTTRCQETIFELPVFVKCDGDLVFHDSSKPDGSRELFE